MKCINCKWARQVGDKSRQDVVGCVLLNGDPSDSFKAPLLSPNSVENSNIYEGYIYFGRKVGDIEDSKSFGKGTLTLGLITDATGSCGLGEELD